MSIEKLTHILKNGKVQIGYQPPGKVRYDKEGTHRLVNLKNVDALRQTDKSGFLKTDAFESFFPQRNTAPYTIEEHDILFASKGHQLQAVCVPLHKRRLSEKMIASSAFYILRIDCKYRQDKAPSAEDEPDKFVFPPFVEWYLNSSRSQKFIMEKARGRGVPHIRSRDVGEITIRIPEWHTQKQIVDLEGELRNEKKLTQEYLETRSELIEKTAEYAITADLET